MQAVAVALRYVSRLLKKEELAKRTPGTEARCIWQVCHKRCLPSIMFFYYSFFVLFGTSFLQSLSFVNVHTTVVNVSAQKCWYFNTPFFFVFVRNAIRCITYICAYDVCCKVNCYRAITVFCLENIQWEK